MTNTLIYFIIGSIITLIMIKHYRKNGLTSNQEFILAVFGIWIWPLQIVKFIYDKVKDKLEK
jgi:hypothetical protein